jgi:hypothetical protein
MTQLHEGPDEPVDMDAWADAWEALTAEILAIDPSLGQAALRMAAERLSTERGDLLLAGGTPFVEALEWVGSYARLGWALRAAERGAVEWEMLYALLPELWTGIERDGADRRYLRLWQDAWAANQQQMILDGPPPRVGRILAVYRGQMRDAQPGIAWTTNRRLAEKAAGGAALRQHKDGIVLMAHVRREDILAYLTGLGDAVAIVDPERLLA